MVARQPSDVQTLERGNIYFVYRPRVERDEVQSAGQVQRLYMVLSPHGKQQYRLLTIGRKQLPDPRAGGRQKYWAFVDKISDDAKAIEEEFDPQHYQTKTRGEREQPTARPVGEGVYRILRHGDHTHLVYALELPRKPGEAQDAFNIEQEGSYIVSVKKPERAAPQRPGLSEQQQPDYPQSLKAQFRGRQFADVDPPAFLDHPGAELLIISADEDVSEELGIDLQPEKETEETAEIFNDLRMEKSEHPVKPLLKGEWE